jgi:hypothetical protein
MRVSDEAARSAGAMLHQLTLLLGRLDPHETHRRAPNCLAGCCGIAASFLLRLT